ncbi:exported hypothetical protein [Candidatus Nitrosotenuis uzonensis]|uniref:NodB homology domain-containing protein n=1 Tax=Candidatus Nitrosotenuis uzonensis TaxID=1407055 RepID=V6ASE7_9ARCH|nr:exported hypothetical protein [Candidatus Nitrosotenuis uzonensis]
MISHSHKHFLFAFILILSACIFAVPHEAFSQSTGTLNVSIKSENGDRVVPQGLVLKVFRGLDTLPLRELSPLNENPLAISSLPLNHRYKVEVYMNSMYAGVGFIDMKKAQEDLEITIKNTGGMRLNIFYKDGQTPIAGAAVTIKSHDGIAWSYSKTDINGNTLRVWLHPSIRDGDHYYAEVSLAKDILFKTAPIKLQPNVAQEFKITTAWPVLVDKLITVEVYNSTTNKVTKQDGSFVAELYDRQKNKVAQSEVTERGLAYFSKLKVNNYQLYIKSKDSSGSLKTVTTKLMPVTESTSIVKVYINNPELNSDHLNCNCVAFRLDDVQDFFLAPAQIAVMSTFEKKQVPLTIGIIGSLIGTDQNLVNTIKLGLANGNLELASHSWNNRVMTQMPKPDQEKLIGDTNQRIRSVFGVTPTTFIPPENVFDETTIQILKDNGFTHISSAATVKEPTPFTKSKFYQFPIVPYTAILNTATGIWEHVPNEQILNKIDESIFDYGYAVVMMHPYEFSLYDNGYTNKVNSTSVERLGALIDTIKSKNIKILPIGSIQDYDAPQAVKPNDDKPEQIPNCNCVAFRLDNVQDFWLNDVQNTVMNTFAESKTPLTLTVIGKFIGDDPKTVNAIKEKLNTSSVRIGSRGWEYLDHSAFDAERQAASVLQTNKKISDVFGVRASVFAPPYDAFSSQTIEAARQAGIKFFSASIVVDKPPYQDSSIRHVPSTAYFENVISDDPFLSGTVQQKALTKVQMVVKQHGFAVISLQASDFAVKHQTFQNEVDQRKIDLLKSLISDMRSSGMSIVFLEMIPSMLDDSMISVPSWIKNNAGWWSEGKITDSEFTTGLEFLIEHKVLKIPPTQAGTGGTKNIPSWIKNNAGWWSEGKITDADFVKGIQYLIENGIIRV